MSPLLPPFSLQSCSTWMGLQNVKCKSHPPSTHTVFPLQPRVSNSVANAAHSSGYSVCTSHTAQNPECRAQTLLCSHPSSVQPFTWPQGWKPPSSPGFLANVLRIFLEGNFLSWCCRAPLSWHSVNQQFVMASFGDWWQCSLPVAQLQLTVDRLVFCLSNLKTTNTD